MRLWRPAVASGERNAVGLYRADTEEQLDGFLGALPLNGWMQISVTPLEPHPSDPTSPRPSGFQLPDPRLTPVYRLEATLGEPVDLGDTPHGHRRIVTLTAGTFTGPAINGKLLPGASADWQTLLPDGTALGDIRYTLQTDSGDVLNVQVAGRAARQRGGSRPAGSRRGRRRERVHVPHLDPDRDGRPRGRDPLNKGVFVSVGGRQPSGVGQRDLPRPMNAGVARCRPRAGRVGERLLDGTVGAGQRRVQRHRCRDRHRAGATVRPGRPRRTACGQTRGAGLADPRRRRHGARDLTRDHRGRPGRRRRRACGRRSWSSRHGRQQRRHLLLAGRTGTSTTGERRSLSTCLSLT